MPDALNELNTKVNDLLDQLRPGHSLRVSTGFWEWTKYLMTIFMAVLVQTIALVVWGTHIVDSHDARISAVEKAVIPIPQIQTDLSSVRETVGRIDERTKMIVDQTKQK